MKQITAIKMLVTILFLSLAVHIHTVYVYAQSSPTGPTIGLKNFLSFYNSLIVVTGVKPTDEIKQHYKKMMTRLAENGRVDEFSSQVALASKDIAGLFCKEFSKNYQAQTDTASMLSDLSERFYQRPLSQAEGKKLTDLMGSLRPQTNKSFMVCTAMLSSIEFLVQK